MQEENVCLKVLAIEVQIATSSKFSATVGCFLCNRNGNSQKGSRGYFYSNKSFLLLEKTSVIFHMSMTLIKNNI